MQETHLTEAESQKLAAKWNGPTFHPKKRGLSILIRHNTPFSHNSTLMDTEGHYHYRWNYRKGQLHICKYIWTKCGHAIILSFNIF